MSKKDIIEKALLQNSELEDDNVVIKADITTTFSMHLFRMLVPLIFNFSMQMKMTDDEIYNFIIQNFTTILDVVITELEIALFAFVNMCEREITDIVELHNKDECLLLIAIKDKVNQKLENIVKKERK